MKDVQEIKHELNEAKLIEKIINLCMEEGVNINNIININGDNEEVMNSIRSYVRKRSQIKKFNKIIDSIFTEVN